MSESDKPSEKPQSESAKQLAEAEAAGEGALREGDERAARGRVPLQLARARPVRADHRGADRSRGRHRRVDLAEVEGDVGAHRARAVARADHVRHVAVRSDRRQGRARSQGRGSLGSVVLVRRVDRRDHAAPSRRPLAADGRRSAHLADRVLEDLPRDRAVRVLRAAPAHRLGRDQEDGHRDRADPAAPRRARGEGQRQVARSVRRAALHPAAHRAARPVDVDGLREPREAVERSAGREADRGAQGEGPAARPAERADRRAGRRRARRARSRTRRSRSRRTIAACSRRSRRSSGCAARPGRSRSTSSSAS